MTGLDHRGEDVGATCKCRRFGVLAGLVALTTWAGCSNDVEIGANHANLSTGGTMGGTGRPPAGAGVGPGGGTGQPDAGTCQISSCQGRVYRCGNCIDDDGDGAADSNDTQCTGPCDDTEDSFFIGIPGANNTPCRQDCYFDQDSGAGNDGCYSSSRCDPLSVAPDYPPSAEAQCAYDEGAQIPGTQASCAELRLTQEAACSDVCGPLTPNGCDCFGCCQLPAGSGRWVSINSTLNGEGSCTEQALEDPARCFPCTPMPSCLNACDPCEACVGRPVPDPGCSEAGAAPCLGGYAVCGAGLPRCAPSQYCITGCCIPDPR